MPSVDFTLEDVRELLTGEREHTKGLFAAEREYTRGLFEAEREHTRGMIDGALMNEREHTKAMITDVFLSFWESNIGPAFDELHTEFAELRREVKSTDRSHKNPFL